MKIDGMVSGLSGAAARARAIEADGYDAAWAGEVNQDPFLPLAVTAEVTDRIEVSTSFARSLPARPWQNTILMSESTIPDPRSDVAARVAQRTLSKRGADYTSEVRRLLDAALEVMRQCGTAARPRVADIVAAAGLSNDAFYRHFPSKDALVAALLDDGTERLASYTAHQMGKESTPEGKVRRWVEGVLSQTREDMAATTLAVIWNGGSFGVGLASSRHSAVPPLAELLREPFAELGSADPAMDASLATHAAVGKISDYLWQRVTPGQAEIDQIAEFCLRAVTPRPPDTTEQTNQ